MYDIASKSAKDLVIVVNRSGDAHVIHSMVRKLLGGRAL